ncbi:MAG: hypothetical protein KDE24_19705, partial [Caldilinea sp.]|nr:hypothetical protein [Caldilinea sp.]
MSIFRKVIVPILIVVAMLVTAACQPIRPPTDMAAPPAPSAEEQAAPAMLAERYTGTLSVAGMELSIIVAL